MDSINFIKGQATDIVISETPKPEIRYTSGRTVYVEGILDDRWVGRYWSSDGYINIPYEPSLDMDAFYIEIDKEIVSTGWQFRSATELSKTETGARHFMVELENKNRLIKVKLHTLLDGTPVITRWLEITNNSVKPMALTAVYPWLSMLVANCRGRGDYSALPKRCDHGFTIGYFTKSHHNAEGWFDWKPLVEPGTTVIGCNKGQSYNSPFFIIRNEVTGQYLIGDLAWSANWRMEFGCKQGESHTLQFKIGPWATDALRIIDPDETIKTPAVHMGLVSGSLDTAVQSMHDHIRNFVLPRRKIECSYLIQYSSTGDQGYSSESFGDSSMYTEENVIDQIDLAVSLGAELFIMDAGWWEQQGDWVPSQSRFPNGLEPIVEYCHKKGLRFGLYAEIEKADPGSVIAREHPEWIKWYKPYPILDLSRPEVAEYLESELTKMIDKYKLDLLRVDYNVPSAVPFEGKSNVRDGIAENNFWRYYESFDRIFEHIHIKYPDLILQQAACGGGRNDLGTVGRFHEQYLTDGLRLPYEIQDYSGQTLSLPSEVIIIGHGADGGCRTGNPENFDTNLRVAFTLSTPWLWSGAIAPSRKELSQDCVDRYVHYANIYKKFIRPLWSTCRVYHHAPVSSRGGVESTGWFAMEFAAKDQTKCWATIVRIGRSETDTYLFKPKGIHREKTYRMTFDSTDETVIVNGWYLVNEGISICLEAIASSELILFEAQ